MSKFRHILVMEDSEEDFETVMEALLLAELSNEVRRVTSGDDCVARLRDAAHSQAALPALVLIDLNTPKSDGRQAILEIKSDRRLISVPMVVISGSANPRDVSFCYVNGVNAYHVKPVIHAQHLLVLRQLLTYWLRTVVQQSELAELK
jgi:CheY-like chemotaxis protein